MERRSLATRGCTTEPDGCAPHIAKRDADRTSALREQVLSYRAERPRDSSVAKAVNDALTFIDLIPATATLPYVALAEDGEVNFYWRLRKSLLIDVGFVGDGMMHYYLWDEASGADVDASIPFSGRSLPPDIVKTMPRRGRSIDQSVPPTSPSPSHNSNCLG